VNKPDDAHFDQANERLKVLCQRWYDGQIDLKHYRDERREILDFLSGHIRHDVDDQPELQPYEAPRRKRWWWPLGK
jgi:chemotaxis regulatin CheY-phosphate phosphatase CheZ